MKKLRILVGGYIGSYCTSGVTWDYIQYPLGLHLLGHDVYYIEDTLGYACHYDPDYKWDDPTPVVNYLEKTMNFFGLKDKWIYRDAISRKSFGIAESRFTEICANADVFINVSGSTYLRDEYLKIPSRVLIDSDPMFTQIPNSANKDMDFEGMGKLFSNYNNLFSFGENINGADCKIPTHGYNWKTTRQPVCLDYWIHNDENYSRKSFSTIMNLAARTNFHYDNQEWGQKDIELEKFISVPDLFNKAEFEIYLSHTIRNERRVDQDTLKEAGWRIYSAVESLKTTDSYNHFIKSSYAEFSVAKETYVKANTGWFSCRSACYLAAGRPVVVQNTKCSEYIPSSKGLFYFDTLDDVLRALEDVVSNYDKHRNFAKEMAREYFDSGKVLTKMLDQLN